MFNEIGKKIKMLAKVSFYIMAGIIGIVGIVVAVSSIDEEPLVSFLTLLGTALVIFFAWIATFVLYGFGELIDKACEISDKLEMNEKSNVNSNYNQSSNYNQNSKYNKKNQELNRLRQLGLITEEDYQKAMSEKEGDQL